MNCPYRVSHSGGMLSTNVGRQGRRAGRTDGGVLQITDGLGFFPVCAHVCVCAPQDFTGFTSCNWRIIAILPGGETREAGGLPKFLSETRVHFSLHDDAKSL